jgi:hypothetical protein
MQTSLPLWLQRNTRPTHWRSTLSTWRPDFVVNTVPGHTPPEAGLVLYAVRSACILPREGGVPPLAKRHLYAAADRNQF